MELKLDQLVVGFDFSPGGHAALHAALAVARKTNAGVLVVTAIPGAINPRVVSILRGVEDGRGDKWEVEADFLERAETLIRREVEGAYDLDGLDVRYDLGQLQATKTLLAAAANAKADMIFVGTVGNQAPKNGHEVGADVKRLSRHSRAPLYVAAPDRPFPPRNILCAVDYSDASKRALGTALQFARTFGAKVHVLHVLPRHSLRMNDFFGRVYPRGYAETERQLADDAMTAMLTNMRTAGLTVSSSVVEGVPDRVILAHCLEQNVDLLAIGTMGRSQVLEFLVGGTAERVIRGARCSLLAVKPDTFGIKKP